MAGFRSPLWLLGVSGQAATGAGGGPTSLLAPWRGGASGSTFVPPEPEPEAPPATLGGRPQDEADAWTLHRQREETQEALLRWRESVARPTAATTEKSAAATPQAVPPALGTEAPSAGEADAGALRAQALQPQIVVPETVARAAVTAAGVLSAVSAVRAPVQGLDLLTLAALLAAADDDD